MTTRRLHLGIILLFTVSIGAAGGYLVATRYGMTTGHAPVTEQHQPAAQQREEKKALYWYDPMQPQQHFDKPGKSPFMDMQLVPQYADEMDTGNSIRIDPALTQNIGMRLVTVTSGTYAPEIVAVGTLTFNERDVAIIQTRTSGYVERVYARAPNDVLAGGAPLADILVPEWVAAQTEFLALVRTGETVLMDAARERLRLLGMSTAQIAHVEKSGKPQAIYTITTPIGGVIQTLEVRAGMTVMAGQTLAQVHGLSTVWMDVAVAEAQGGQVRMGDQAEAHFTAYPGEIFTGQIIALLPETNTESRTLRVRIELDNVSGRFRPGMYAEVKLHAAEQQTVLQLPSEAIIRTGERTLVILAEDKGRYRPVEVEVGRETDGQTVILQGLAEGQQVVASGQFLIDSEASLKGIAIRPIETGHDTGEHTGDHP